MSLFRRASNLTETLIPSRSGRSSSSSGKATISEGMQHSVIWAAMTVRAATESMMPIDVYRRSGPTLLQVPTPAVLVNPSDFADGHPDTIADWLYAGRMALDGCGNNFGEITARDGLGLPSRVELIPIEDVRCRVKDRRIVEYKFGRTVVEPRRVWHERQYLLPGVPVGLSPITYAALSIDGARAATRYAAEWFQSGAIPAAHLRNEEKTLKAGESEAVKQRFKDSLSAGDVFVSGKDWTYAPLQAKAIESGFIDQMNYSSGDLLRFFGVDADIVDVPVSGSATINYANLTQRNLQFLTLRMGPALKRREDALSSLTASPRFVKLNRSAFLAMDDKMRAELLALQIESRQLAPSEARSIVDRQPYTDEQLAEFDRLFGSKNQTPTPKGIPA